MYSRTAIKAEMDYRAAQIRSQMGSSKRRRRHLGDDLAPGHLQTDRSPNSSR